MVKHLNLKLTELRKQMSRGMVARMAADAAMVNLALALALVVRLFIELAFEQSPSSVETREIVFKYGGIYLQNALPLTFLCLLVFTLSGFYTYGRAYQSRFKALTITSAVVHAYLGFGFATYLLWERLGLTELPRGALLIAFALNLGACLASRTWTFLWEHVIRPEREPKVRSQRRTGRNILVIGGAGYIGSALLPKLLNNGYRVRVLDMFFYGNEPIAGVVDHPRLELMEGDFRHVDKAVAAMQDMDAVVHLGAIVGDPACDLDEKVTVGVNLSATQMIAQVAKASGVSKFVFASTCSVYGACDEILDEHSEVRPISLYGHTKLAAERGLRKMADESFMPTILRFATIYGLSGRTRFDLVVNLLTAKARTENQITIHGGDQWRPFVHVDDAALSVLKVLQAPISTVGNEIFNVGSNDQNYTITQVGELVRDQVFGAEMVIDNESADKRNYRVDFTKIGGTLDYKPHWTVETGIQQVLEAIATGEVEDYREARYSNVKFLKDTNLIETVRVDDDWSRELETSRARDLEPVAS